VPKVKSEMQTEEALTCVHEQCNPVTNDFQILEGEGL